MLDKLLMDLILIILKNIDVSKDKTKDMNIYSVARVCKKIYEICKNNKVFSERRKYNGYLKESVFARSTKYLEIEMIGNLYGHIVEDLRKMPWLVGIKLCEKIIIRVGSPFVFDMRLLENIKEFEINAYMIEYDLLMKLVRNDKLRSLIVVTENIIRNPSINCLDAYYISGILTINDIGNEYKRIIVTTKCMEHCIDKEAEIEEEKLKYKGYIKFGENICMTRKVEEIPTKISMIKY
jgi:hypothetical protein